MYTYQFECTVLIKKILKLSKKSKLKSFFKEGFEFQGKYFICLEKCLKIETETKTKKFYDLVIETEEGGLWRIPLLKKDPGRKWWPDEKQIPNKEVVNILKKLYAFLKA